MFGFLDVLFVVISQHLIQETCERRNSFPFLVFFLRCRENYFFFLGGGAPVRIEPVGHGESEAAGAHATASILELLPCFQF